MKGTSAIDSRSGRALSHGRKGQRPARGRGSRAGALPRAAGDQTRRIGDLPIEETLPRGAEPVWRGPNGTLFLTSLAWAGVGAMLAVALTSRSVTLVTALIPDPSGQQLVAACAEGLVAFRPCFIGGQQSCSSAVAGRQEHRPTIWSEKTKARLARSAARYRTRKGTRPSFMAA